MHFSFRLIYIFTLLGLLVAGCGKQEESVSLKLSGKVHVDTELIDENDALFVIVSSGSDLNRFSKSPEESVIVIYPVDQETGEYVIELSDTELGQGDEILVTGLLDKNYNSDIPMLDEGDYIGFYFNRDKMSPSCIIGENNTGCNFSIDRRVYSWEAGVSGKITGPQKGDVVVFGYTGQIDSLDITELDIGGIVSYDLFKKESDELSFSMNLLPYGFDLPIDSVNFFVLYDENSNGVFDPGEWFGCHSETKGFFPTPVRVEAGKTPNLNIQPVYQIPAPSPDPVILSGKATVPVSVKSESGDALFGIVTKEVYPGQVLNNLTESVLYFEKITDKSGQYSFDLSTVGINPGEKIGVYFLWDRDYNGSFPEITADDYIGYYFQTGELTLFYEPAAGDNFITEVFVDKKVRNDSKSISGTISESAKIMESGIDYRGDIILFAFEGPISSSDFSKLDFTTGVGLSNLSKTASGPTSYELELIPAGLELPLSSLYVYALYDQNRNGKPDGGEYYGYHTGGSGTLPETIVVTATTDTPVDITIVNQIPIPSDDAISISGSILMPAGFADDEDPAAFVLVLDNADPESLLNVDAQDIIYFEKIAPKETYYKINLEKTSLRAGEKAGIYILWDRDNDGGLPSPGPGDYLGYYIDQHNMTNLYSLVSGVNPNVDIVVDKQLLDYERSLSGSILMGESFSIPEPYSGQVIVFAYNGEINRFSFSDIDFNHIRGYKKLIKDTGLPLDYELKILPYNDPLPIENTFIFALYDQNNNGKPDPNEYYGYRPDAFEFPGAFTITETTPEDNQCDIQMMRQIPEPSGVPISLKGSVNLMMLEETVRETVDLQAPNQAAYIIINRETATGNGSFEDFTKLFGSSIVYFEKLNPPLVGGKIPFTLNLSETGLAPGDKIGAYMLYERDSSGRFPSFTKGDYVGMHINKTNYDVYFELSSGENDISCDDGLAPDEGRHFDLNRKMFFEPPGEEVSVAFSIVSSTYKINGGDSIILLAVHDTGVIGNSFDTDYSVILKTIEVEGDGEAVDVNRDVFILPVLLEEIVNTDGSGNFVSVDDVKIIAIVDRNKNMKFDDGDVYGYYNSLHTGLNMSKVTIEASGTEIYIPIVLKKL